MGELLAFFPEPYEDEDFRSLIHRYHIRSGNKNFRDSKIDLFDVSSHKNIHFPCNYNFYQSKLPNTTHIELEKLLKENTFYSLFKPFITIERHNLLLKSIREDKGNKKLNLGNLFGMKQDRIISEKIKYCPVCIDEDYEKYGEVYVHRLHQFEFNDYCYIHQIKLVSQCSQCNSELSNSKKTNLLSMPICINGHKISEGEIILDREHKLNQQIFDYFYQMLNHENNISRESLLGYISIVLASKGYVDNNGKYKRAKLMEDLLQKFSADELTDVGLSQKYINSPDVFLHLLSREIVPDIRLYIILMMFLGISLKEVPEIEPLQSHFIVKELNESQQQIAASVDAGDIHKPISRSKINWHQYDVNLSARVENAFIELYKSNPSKPIKKWSAISILNTVDQSRIRRNLEKLPLTRKVFEKRVETVENFQKRKLPLIIKKLEKKGLRNITYRSICYELPELYDNCSDEVRVYIINELKKRGYIDKI